MTIPKCILVAMILMRVLPLLAAPGTTAPTEGATANDSKLTAAIRVGRVDDAKQLVAQGANIDEVTAQKGESPLQLAARFGHLELIRLLIERGADPDGFVAPASPPLADAVIFKQFAAASLLLELGANINATNQANATALNIACAEKNSAAVKWLLEHKADVSIANSFGVLPLHRSAMLGDLASVKLLLAAGAEPNAHSDKYSAIGQAALKGHWEIVDALIEAGGPLDLDLEEPSVMASAARDGKLELLQRMFAQRVFVRPNRMGLHLSVPAGQIEATRLLLEHDAQLSDAGVRTTVEKAATNGRGQAIVQLLEAQRGWSGEPNDTVFNASAELISLAETGDVPAIQKHFEKNAEISPKLALIARSVADARGEAGIVDAINRGVNAVIEKYLRVQQLNAQLIDLGTVRRDLAETHAAVQRLLAEGADADAHDEESGFGAIHSAVSWMQPATVELLIERGAKINARRGYGHQTPLYTAAGEGRADVVKLLINKGADVDLPNQEGFTPLCHAASANHLEVVRVLLEAKAKADTRAYFGRTALSTAVDLGHIDVVKLLIANKADVNIAGEDGATPLAIALARGRSQIAGVLRQAGAKDGAPRPLLNIGAIARDGEDALRDWLNNGGDPNAIELTGYRSTLVGLIEATSNTAPETRLNMIKMLLDAGAVIQPDHLALITAVHQNCDARIVSLLIASGASVGERNVIGETPLLAAARYRGAEVIQALLDANADITARNNHGNTALDIAKARKPAAPTIVELLEKAEKSAVRR